MTSATVRPAVSTAAIRVDRVSKSFGGRSALNQVSIEVATGSMHGLLGPNGAGKTTLLRLMFGLAAPDAGAVEVLNRNPYANPADALRGVAGFVEAPAFYPYLSAEKNLDLLAALDGSAATGRVDAVLEQVGLAGRNRDRVSGFSTGMKQRLGIAAALLRDPQLLILDEPVSGLDPEGAHELHELLVRFAASGRTVLLSSHDMTEVERLCDTVTILAAGAVRYSGKIEELRQQAPDPSYALGTADNVAAARIAVGLGLQVETDLEALMMRASLAQLDDFVLALGRQGIAVRRLVRRDTSLEALFLRMTA